MNRRYPVQDQVAIVGVGTTPFSRDSGKSDLALVVEASKMAIRDAGLTKEDINGISATYIPAHFVQGVLGIPELSWFNNCWPTFPQQVINAMNAVFSGVCDTVLLYHSMYRTPFSSAAAAADPFRANRRGEGGVRPQSHWPDSLAAAPAYACWGNRYFEEFGGKREYLGYVAINSRTNASMNEHAIIRTPMTMEDYLSARMVRAPLLGVLDMDYPVDGGDALIITTAERARDLPHKPVLVHAATLGQTNNTVEENIPDLEHTAHQVIRDNLWARSELSVGDMDLFFPYDGFTFICLKWFENIGYCDVGEAGPFIEDNWDKDSNRIMIGGRVPVNTHGGSLSEGGTQGSGHIREAVVQLRGEAGDRQVANPESALVTAGGFFQCSGGLVLRT